MKNLLTTALIATTLASPVRGEEPLDDHSVGDFYRSCNSIVADTMSVDTETFYECLGKAAAIRSTSQMMCHLKRTDTFGGVPYQIAADTEGVPLDAVIRSMINFAEQNPQTWTNGIGVYLIGLAAVWPCN